MRKHHRPVAALAAVAAVVMIPGAAAEAANKSVFAGPPRPVKTLPKGVDLVHFFPKHIKVAQGKSIDFHFRGFHTITFLGKEKLPPFFVPSGTVSGVNDAAGNPFWFNGQTRFVLNPQVGAPIGDGRVDNRAMESSGLPAGEGPPKRFTLKFNKAGTFRYVCLVHPKMHGRVTVVKKRRGVPSVRSDEARMAKEIAKLVRVAKRRAAYPGPGGANVRAGNDTDDMEVLRYFPSDVRVKAGSTVRWFSRHPHEFHTVTFGPPDYLKPIGESFIAPDTSAPQGGPPTLVANPLAVYPSDAPRAVPGYDGTNHGNGFLNSGLFQGDPKAPLPREWSARFTKPGTYQYICLVHGPEMSGKVTVTP